MIERESKLVLVGLLLVGAIVTTGCDDGLATDAGPGREDGSAGDGGDDTDAGPGIECDPGDMRTAGCGFCGTESQMCEEPGTWMATSECLGQGECELGAVESRTGALCEEEQRICLDGCTWGDWEPVGVPGECEVGETREIEDGACAAGEQLVQTCGDTCLWPAAGVGTCESLCTWAPQRTTPEWKREVCVPAGDFIRGLDGSGFAEPMATITLSAFYIDAYPVTNRRYNECVAAGVCAAADGAYARTDAAHLDFPVQGISRNEAIDFCAWDGGRRLVTAAEWQKAARGPAPRTNLYPWGDMHDCAIVDVGREPCFAAIPDDGFAVDPYDAFGTNAASFYGAQMMGFGVREWVRDLFCTAFWDSQPESLVPDPICDETQPSYVEGWLTSYGGMRGWGADVIHRPISNRMTGDDDSRVTGFRCGHSM